MCNTYPYHSRYNNLIEKGYRILEPYMLSYFDDIVHYERYGDHQKDLRTLINNYFYELYRLVEWLEYIDNHLLVCGKSCLTQEEIEKSKTKFLIDCPLICSNPRSRELIALFENSIPTCGTTSYQWYNVDTCYQGNVIRYKVRSIIDGVESIINIPYTATIADIIALGIPDPWATNLFNTRIVQLNSPDCCQYSSVNPPFLDVIAVTTSSITLSYVLQNPQATGTITLGSQTINLVEPTGTVTFTGLNLNTSYNITMTVSNCAGSLTINRTVSTLPYLVIIELGPNVTGNIQILGQFQVGINQVGTYCSQINIAWQGINNIHEITEFLVNGQSGLSDVTWNQVFNNKNIGGVYTIPCIDRDYTIYIEGIRALDCDDITTDMSGNTITISL